MEVICCTWTVILSLICNLSPKTLNTETLNNKNTNKTWILKLTTPSKARPEPKLRNNGIGLNFPPYKQWYKFRMKSPKFMCKSQPLLMTAISWGTRGLGFTNNVCLFKLSFHFLDSCFLLILELKFSLLFCCSFCCFSWYILIYLFTSVLFKLYSITAFWRGA